MLGSETPGACNKSFSLEFGKDIPGVLMLNQAESMDPMRLQLCHWQHRGFRGEEVSLNFSSVNRSKIKPCREEE